MKTKLKTITLIVISLLITSINASAVTIEHPWSGKKAAYLGDSVTDPRHKASNQKYWYWLEQWLGLTPYVYAVSGRQWNDVPRQVDKLRTEHGDDVDAILIFMGTNDYNNAVPLGRWYDETMEDVEYGHRYEKRPESRMHRTPSMDSDTFRGRINIALDSLKRTYPDKQIILLTPIHRSGFYANEKNWQVPEDYANRCGLYLDDYVEAVKEAGQVWAVPVIDLGAACGLYPLMDEYAKYFNDAETDRLHPNTEGHRRMAQTLMQQLLLYPIF
ncbi:MAG: SGNH/GDSL hydrolase family protein [Lachnoclostridium sp.]|nr:SGNH/GDSL hydrolase family protein [Lachnoclostridium sp.]